MATGLVRRRQFQQIESTGGQGEILSAPDSESAFGLFESYTTLYEVTKNKKWLMRLAAGEAKEVWIDK